MNFPITQNYIQAQAKAAYQNFDGRNSPFAAIRLNIALGNRHRNDVDEIVEDNFRSETDLIFKNDGAYLILMQDTTLEAAERATKRLKFSLDLSDDEFINTTNHGQNHASAHILGSSRGTKRLVMKYIDLSAPIGFKAEKNTAVKSNLHEYRKWLNLSVQNGLQIRQKISLKI